MTAVDVRKTAVGIRGRRVQLFPVITTVVVVLLVGGPLAFMIFASFRGPQEALPLDIGAFWTLKNYGAVFSMDMVHALVDTAIFTFGSLFVGLGVAIPMAFLLERTNVPGRRIFSVLMFAPMLIPPITGAQIWSLLLSENRGLLNRMIRAVLPFWHSGPFSTTSATGIVLAQGLTFVPIAVLFLGTAFRNIDASLEEASRVSGATAFTTARRITLMLVTPAITSVALLMCISLLGAFEIPLVFGLGEGLTPIGVRIYQMLNPPSSLPLYGQVASWGVVLTILGFTLIYLYGRLTRSAERYATLTGKGHRGAPARLGKWRWPVFGGFVAFFSVFVGLRVFVLVWQTFLPFVDDVGLSELRKGGDLEAYRQVLADPEFWRAVRITILVAFSAAIVTTTVAMSMSWVVVRYKGRRAVKAALDMIASTSLSVPAPVAAFAFLILFLGLNRIVPVYGTIGSLIFAYCFRIGYPFRLSSAATLQIGKELEEASSASGATPTYTLRRVLLPLLAPTVMFIFVMGIITAVQEFAVPLFIRSVGTKPISIYTFSELTANRPRNAAVVGVLTLVGVLVVAGIASAVAARFRPSAKS
ncbi:MAG: iron transporter permease [Acidimicrobiales bacterium]|nr:iron transporter permease [Acidimicrobiales bacterium]